MGRALKERRAYSERGIHISELALHELEGGNRLTKLLPLMGVGEL